MGVGGVAAGAMGHEVLLLTEEGLGCVVAVMIKILMCEQGAVARGRKKTYDGVYCRSRRSSFASGEREAHP